MRPQTEVRQYSIASLIYSFAAWKALLLLVAICSPGPGYDTSTRFALSNNVTPLPAPLHYLAIKLTRWDAIYFVKAAVRGYRFEQEWAFGWGFSRMIALCTAVIERLGIAHHDGIEAIVAIVIAHGAHLLSVLALYRLTLAIFPAAVRVAYIAAALHTISPAGLFLSSPYAESSCALLTFLGCLFFTQSLGPSALRSDIAVIASGLLFGVATTFRSNGLLNGVLLLEEALRTLYCLRQGFHPRTVRRLFATGLGGVAVAIGFLLPQYIAYVEYCGIPRNSAARPWCNRTLPSIYTFVQVHYWNNGFLRYWTLSNLPLFILGAPMFTIMAASGLWALRDSPLSRENDVSKVIDQAESQRYQVLCNLAATQLLFTVYTLTTAHAQIITRISSASPVWMWFLAVACSEDKPIAKYFVRFSVIYAMVQGGLFASFLPPA